ncbi:excalibur calcium-binding domain-containing protein [Nocardia sp. NPDC005978]|uniref:excalibur calcium-binding domain-containing protein n=1 Tax=Nocardia sp. NPDC005978 TaxID=3156725 RepID=UPI0033BB046D
MQYRSFTAEPARTGLIRLTATLACSTAVVLAGTGVALADPLELETSTLNTEVGPAAPSGGEIATGTGSASLSANPGSASGSAGSGSGAGGSGTLPPGTGFGTLGSGSASKLGLLGPTIANGIDSLMRGLGFAPGNYTSCADVERTGVGPLLRGTPGYNALLDPDGDGVACE